MVPRKKPSSYVPTPDLLHSGIRHVCYEYKNLISAAHYSMNGQAPWRTHCDDAFLLGYRKLRDFLLDDYRSTHGRAELLDILALDYLPSNSTRCWSLPTWDKEWRHQMNKQLAHLSFKRDKEWNHLKWLPLLEQEMQNAWSKFLLEIDQQYASEFHLQLEIAQT